MTVLATYNVGPVTDLELVEDVTTLFTHENPDAVGLNEMAGRQAVLARIRRGGTYTPVQVTTEPNSAKLAALIHKRVTIDFVDLVDLTRRTFVGYNTAGARKDGHVEDKFILMVGVTMPDGQKLVLGVIHTSPSAMRKGNWRTRRVYRAQVRKAARWAAHRKRNFVLMGDFNMDVSKPTQRRYLRPLYAAARAAGGVARFFRSMRRRWIDGFFTSLHGTARAARGKYHSDHRPGIFTEETP